MYAPLQHYDILRRGHHMPYNIQMHIQSNHVYHQFIAIIIVNEGVTKDKGERWEIVYTYTAQTTHSHNKSKSWYPRLVE